jgi:CRP-like cAMP-binding protein
MTKRADYEGFPLHGADGGRRAVVVDHRDDGDPGEPPLGARRARPSQLERQRMRGRAGRDQGGPGPVADGAGEARRIMDRLRRANGVLARLSDELFASLSDHLAPVMLPAGAVLIEALRPPRTVFFPLEGLNSTMLHLEDGSSAEVVLGGRGGMVGVSALTGASCEDAETRTLISGQALGMSAVVFRRLIADTPALRDALFWVVPMLLSSMGVSIACNARHGLERRLARWLLAASAQTGGTRLALSQATLAMSLGVRRAGVSEALTYLSEAGLVVNGRNLIVISDRTKLAAHACECHHQALAAWTRHAPMPDPAYAIGSVEIRALADRRLSLRRQSPAGL